MLATRYLPVRLAGSLGLAIGLVILTGLVFLALATTAGDPFGTLNDLSMLLAAVLSAALAWVLYPSQRNLSPQLGLLAPAAATLGALLVVAGAALLALDSADPVWSRQFVQFGYGLIGVWLLVRNALALQNGAWSRGLALTGIFAGACMAVGLLNGLGIVSGVDSGTAAPWFLQAEAVALVGGLVLYPIWTFWLAGRAIWVARTGGDRGLRWS